MPSLIDHPNVDPMYGSYEVVGPSGNSGVACMVRPSGNTWVVDVHRPEAGVVQDSEHSDVEAALAAALRRVGVKL